MPPFGQPYSLLGLANNTCIKDTFIHINDRFNKLYKRKAHLHHYTQVDDMDMNLFVEANNSINELINDYAEMEKQQLRFSRSDASELIERVKILA